MAPPQLENKIIVPEQGKEESQDDQGILNIGSYVCILSKNTQNEHHISRAAVLHYESCVRFILN